VTLARVLFEPPQTPRVGPLGWAEPSVHWFTESTRPAAVASRRNVNRWYAEFPDPDGGFGARLRSEVNADHYQAVDELHVHSLLKRTHGDVRYEEGGVGPDFRVYEDGEQIAAVEVASLFQQAEWTLEQTRHALLADEVNRRLVPSAGYFVDFQIEAALRNPAPRRFAEWLQRQLDQLPAYDRVEPHAEPSHDQHSFVYVEEGVRIRVRFITMRPGAAAVTDPDARIVGMGPVVGGVVLAAPRLKDRIGTKAGGRYDLRDSPFVVAVGVHDAVCTDHDVVEALYGGESAAVDSGRRVRRNDGLFGTDAMKPSGRQSRLSGAAIISEFRAWEPDAADIALLRNPHAAHSWPGRVLPVTREFGIVASTTTEFELGWKQP
jgi:hypothetical protein